MKNDFFKVLIFLFFGITGLCQTKTVSSDKNWVKQSETLKNAYEAEYIIRVGDIDNLNFGFPEEFDPFCGRLTDVHNYPWKGTNTDLPGMDRIMVSSKGINKDECGSDGYSFAVGEFTKGPVRVSIPTALIKDVDINNAWLQLFIDDFQAPVFCSRFRMMLNNVVFLEGEQILNAVNQTGPVGKLVTIPIPQEFHSLLNKGNALNLMIDEINGVPDGFAIDFIRILINRVRENTCKGDINGFVIDKETQLPVENALVTAGDGQSTKTNNKGFYTLKSLPTGYEALLATATGYVDGREMADIAEGNENPEVNIFLKKGQSKILYIDKTIAVGESVTINNILFDQGKDILRPTSLTELEKIVSFLKSNPTVEIELSGHTSSEGDPQLNKNLSYLRVKACRDFIAGKGIEVSRLSIKGFGPDKPIAPNDTEINRAKNRRVEMRITKM